MIIDNNAKKFYNNKVALNKAKLYGHKLIDDNLFLFISHLNKTFFFYFASACIVNIYNRINVCF